VAHQVDLPEADDIHPAELGRILVEIMPKDDGKPKPPPKA